MSEPQNQGASRRIVVADDNDDVAESLTILLRLEGHDVTSVRDGDAALRVIETLQPDIAMLDIGMPGMNGYDIARRVRNLQLPVMLVAVTGWGAEADRAKALDAGFDRHFTKPVEPDALTALCKDLPPPQKR